MNNEKRDHKNKDINKVSKLGKIQVNVFMESKNGVVIFDNLSHGNYRVIEIIDKEIYEKPVYKSWNEVNISNYTKETIIDVINKKK